jgi:hypothetical protein
MSSARRESSLGESIRLAELGPLGRVIDDRFATELITFSSGTCDTRVLAGQRRGFH